MSAWNGILIDWSNRLMSIFSNGSVANRNNLMIKYTAILSTFYVFFNHWVPRAIICSNLIKTPSDGEGSFSEGEVIWVLRSLKIGKLRRKGDQSFLGSIRICARQRSEDSSKSILVERKSHDSAFCTKIFLPRVNTILYYTTTRCTNEWSGRVDVAILATCLN